ncbi:MAG TPA: acetyltransferase [Halieaceae bacterium]|nr:acetyltransferase [Halieaceae bacterium]
MADFDVFNGDADGICALLQLRLAEPRDATLVTGVKRDISLLGRVQAGEGDRVTVLDISLDKNREPLEGLLGAGARVWYCDHHFAGDIPAHPGLEAHINTEATVCTSSLVNGYLEGAHRPWAVVGSFGDNLRESAAALARPLGRSGEQLERLENLGIYINYNGYGPDPDELHFHPADLFRELLPYAEPEDFMADNRPIFERLETGYHEDLGAARELSPEYADAHAAVFVLPAASWSRRVSGVYSNELTNANPDRAHAVITPKRDGGLLVSVRAPLSNRSGADELCREFPTGGGRAAAAGINDLPEDQLQTFIDRFAGFYASR